MYLMLRWLWSRFGEPDGGLFIWLLIWAVGLALVVVLFARYRGAM